MKENQRKCVKCGSSPAEDPKIKLFRFPKPGSTNALRCELWANYCFPDQLWASRDFQNQLYSQHSMLCHRHFKETDFVDFSLKKLRRFASPEIEEVTMPYSTVAAEPIASPEIEEVTMPYSTVAAEPIASPEIEEVIMPYSTVAAEPIASPEIEEVTVPYSTVAAEPIVGPSRPLVDLTNIPLPLPAPSAQSPLVDLTNIPLPLPAPSAQSENVIKQKDEQSALIAKCKEYRKKISELQRKIRHMKSNKYLNKSKESAAFECLSKKISPTFAFLLKAQIRNYNRDPRGRRWSMSDKITALILFKRSPSCYRMMRRMFSLPSPSSLKSILKACGKLANSQKPENLT